VFLRLPSIPYAIREEQEEDAKDKNTVRETFLLVFLSRRFVALRKPGSRFKNRKRQKNIVLKLSRKLYLQFGSNRWLEDLSLLTWTDIVCSNHCTRDRFGEAMKVSEACREKEGRLTWMSAAPWVDQIPWRRDSWFGIWVRKRLLETISSKFYQGRCLPVEEGSVEEGSVEEGSEVGGV